MLRSRPIDRGARVPRRAPACIARRPEAHCPDCCHDGPYRAAHHQKLVPHASAAATLRPHVDEWRPDVRLGGLAGPRFGGGMMQGRCGAVGLDFAGRAHRCVNGLGDCGGGVVSNRPQGGDDVRIRGAGVRSRGGSPRRRAWHRRWRCGMRTDMPADSLLRAM